MYQFTEDCLTGIDLIDDEHRRLFELINDTFFLVQKEQVDMETVGGLVLELQEYAKNHFAHEESYMQEHKDPELPRQKREHAVFEEKIAQISLEGLDGSQGKAVVEELLSYLSRWLYHHILGSDIMIGKMMPVQKAAEDREDVFAFTDKYRTGIELIDEEHRRLFEIIRETNDVIHAEFLHDKYDEIMHILTELKNYTVSHFSDEEDHMQKLAYAGLDAQKRAHEAFVEKLNDINLDAVDENQEEYLEELISFLLGWLSNHIMKMDKLIPSK